MCWRFRLRMLDRSPASRLLQKHVGNELARDCGEKSKLQIQRRAQIINQWREMLEMIDNEWQQFG